LIMRCKLTYNADYSMDEVRVVKQQEKNYEMYHGHKSLLTSNCGQIIDGMCYLRLFNQDGNYVLVWNLKTNDANLSKVNHGFCQFQYLMEMKTLVLLGSSAVTTICEGKFQTLNINLENDAKIVSYNKEFIYIMNDSHIWSIALDPLEIKEMIIRPDWCDIWLAYNETSNDYSEVDIIIQSVTEKCTYYLHKTRNEFSLGLFTNLPLNCVKIPYHHDEQYPIKYIFQINKLKSVYCYVATNYESQNVMRPSCRASMTIFQVSKESNVILERNKKQLYRTFEWVAVEGVGKRILIKGGAEVRMMIDMNLWSDLHVSGFNTDSGCEELKEN